MSIVRPSTYLINRSSLQVDIKNQLRKWWNIHHDITSSPAAKPVPLDRSAFELIRQEPFVAAEKSDGVSYILMISRYEKSRRPFAILINRALCMYQVEIYAPTSMFDGTMFDGELVYNHKENCLVYLVFDVIRFKGRSTITMNYIDRYKIINNAFPSESEWNETHTPKQAYDLTFSTNRIISIPSTICRILFYSKPCVQMRDFESLYRTSRTLNHESDGYIFTPIYASVKRNTHKYMYKWKFSPTVDLQCHNSQLYCIDPRGELIQISKLFPMYQFVYAKQGNIIVEFTVKINETRISLDYVRNREDKRKPNSYITVASVFKEVQDHITFKEIIELSHHAATRIF